MDKDADSMHDNIMPSNAFLMQSLACATLGGLKVDGELTVWEVGLISQAGAVQELLLELQRLLTPNLQVPHTLHVSPPQRNQVFCQ